MLPRSRYGVLAVTGDLAAVDHAQDLFFSSSRVAEFVWMRRRTVAGPRTGADVALFAGTIFIDPDIITDHDPTAYTSIIYSGQGERTMFDRRLGGWITTDPFLFDARTTMGSRSKFR